MFLQTFVLIIFCIYSKLLVIYGYLSSALSPHHACSWSSEQFLWLEWPRTGASLRLSDLGAGAPCLWSDSGNGVQLYFPYGVRMWHGLGMLNIRGHACSAYTHAAYST